MFDQLAEWQLARLGKFTASEIHKLLVKGKGGDYFGQGAMTYIRSKAAEILTCEPCNGGRVNGYALEWGNSTEHEAFQKFAEWYKLEAEYYGGANPKFFEYTNFSGGSPDGIVPGFGIIEIKCPFNSGEHLEHLAFSDAESIKDYCPEYYWQMTANMLFTGLHNAFFVSYDPRFADEFLRLKVVQFEADPADLELLKERITEAEKQLSLYIKLIRNDFNVLIAEHDAETNATIIQ